MRIDDERCPRDKAVDIHHESGDGRRTHHENGIGRLPEQDAPRADRLLSRYSTRSSLDGLPSLAQYHHVR